MTDSLPIITLVTPSFNQAEFLERTIVSVLSQNYPKLEYIVMDGGSGDGSVEIIKKYEADITHWQSAKDNGQGDAIVRGWKMGTGAMIGWLNSDDVLLPRSLFRLAELFERGRHDIVTGETLCVDENDIISSFIMQWRGPMWMYRAALLHPGQPGTFYSRRLAEDVGYFDENLSCAMEFDLVMKMMKRRARVGNLTVPVAALRHHKQTKSRLMERKFQDENRAVFEKHAIFPFNNTRLREATVRFLRYPYALRYLNPVRLSGTKNKIKWTIRTTSLGTIS